MCTKVAIKHQSSSSYILFAVSPYSAFEWLLIVRVLYKIYIVIIFIVIGSFPGRVFIHVSNMFNPDGQSNSTQHHNPQSRASSATTTCICGMCFKGVAPQLYTRGLTSAKTEQNTLVEMLVSDDSN